MSTQRKLRKFLVFLRHPYQVLWLLWNLRGNRRAAVYTGIVNGTPQYSIIETPVRSGETRRV